MKSLLAFVIFSMMVLSCSNNQSPINETPAAPETGDKTFSMVADFPIIKDTSQFILELRQSLELKVHESPAQKEKEKISTYRKVNLYGSDKDYIFIEYDWNTGSMADFPYKYQILLTAEGKLVGALSGRRYELVHIFKNQNPFLMTVVSSSKGNGGHQIFKILADTLENAYEGYFDSYLQTYDAHQDLSVYQPNELSVTFKDDNNDGYNDIIFSGQKLMLGKYTKDGLWYDVENGIPFSVENPADEISIKYVFLYDQKTGHFKAKEEYTPNLETR